MKAEIAEQYEAHVAFELKQLKGEQGADFVDRELRIVWDTVGKMHLSELLTVEQVQSLIRRQVLEGPVTEAMLELVGSTAFKIIRSDKNPETTIEALVSEEARLAFVAQLISMKKLRNDLIHTAVGNPLYAELVSDLLYNGMAGYMEAGTELTNKVPGMGSLMKKGGSMLSKRVGSIEDRLRDYISNNMQSILGKSEKMLRDSLTDEKLNEISEQVWKAIRRSEPSISEHLNDDDISAFVDIGATFWRHFRQTDYLRELINQGVESVFSHAGDLSLQDWAASLGITADLVSQEVRQQWAAIESGLSESGYLDAATRARLEPFYQQL